MTFGEKLRSQRKKQGKTVAVIAKSCETSRSYLTLIENGKRLPGKKLLPKIAAVLGIKTVDVLNWYLEDVSHKIQKELKII